MFMQKQANECNGKVKDLGQQLKYLKNVKTEISSSLRRTRCETSKANSGCDTM
jgi:hypothetical protein